MITSFLTRPLSRLGATLLFCSSLALSSHAAVTPTIQVKVSPATLVVDTKTTITGTVTAGAAGQQLELQRKNGKKWIREAVTQLPAKGAKKKGVFKITPSKAGRFTYRLALAKKGKTPAARSKTINLSVRPKIELAVKSSLKNETSNATFTGTVKGGPEGQTVVIQRLNGKKWENIATATTTGTGNAKKFKTKASIPITRSAKDKGAPLLTYRAVTRKGTPNGTSELQKMLIYSKWSGILYRHDPGEEYAKDVGTVTVLYHMNWFRLYLGGVEVEGTTDGWELVDKAGWRMKFKRYYNVGDTYTHQGESYVVDSPRLRLEGVLNGGTLFYTILKP